MLKMSYVITSVRPFSLIGKVLESIKSLGPHEHEIIITSPIDYSKECDALGIQYYCDDANRGSVPGNNLGYWKSTGDYIFFLPDDFPISNRTDICNGLYYDRFNIAEFIQFLQSDQMQQKTFKMFTMYTRTCHMMFGEQYESPITEPYQVMHFPVVARETIEDHLDGVIFNESFKHGFVDHWLGLYAARHEQYQPYNYSLFKEPNDPPTCKCFVEHPPQNFRSPHFDKYDYNMLEKKYKALLMNPGMKYNE